MLKAVLLLPFKPLIIAGKAYWKFLDELGVESSGYRSRNYKPPTTRIGNAWDRFVTVIIYVPCYFITTVFDSNALWSYAIDRERFGYYKLDKRKYGFTLIELAIVLLIIGTIVGGIVVGREMIRNAELRKVITDTDKFITAYYTFKNKYNCLPGDCDKASQFFSGALNGDNDGVLEFQTGMNPDGANIWHHLASAGLIEGSYPTVSNINNITNLSYYPVGAVKGSYYTVRNVYRAWPTDTAAGEFQYSGLVAIATRGIGGNYILMSGDAGIGANWSILNTLTSQENKMIDEKIDDGKPNSGKVGAVSTSYGGGGCFVATTDPNAVYVSAASSTPACIFLRKLE